MKKRVLVLLGRYFPKASANSICTQNILDLLPKEKYDIEIICYKDGLNTNTGYKVSKISRGLIHNLDYKFESKSDRISGVLRKCCTLLIKAKLLPFLFVWPWADPIFTYKVYRKAEELNAICAFDYVLSIHMPISSLIVGNKLKKKHNSIKYIPVFWDSLSGGVPISLFSKEWNLNKKLKWERKLLKNADKIVVMESSRLHHLKYSKMFDYYTKFIYLDIPLLVCHNTRDYISPFNKEKINVVFCGTANFPMRNIEYFGILAKNIENIDNRIMFYVIGKCNCTNYFTSTNITYLQEIPHDKLPPYIACSDVLLNFGVKTPSAISGKIFEYMAYAKPIISTYSIAEEACIPYLKKYPVSLLIDENDVNYESQARKIVDFINYSVNKKIDIVEIRNIFKNNMPETFDNAIFGAE